MRHTVDRVHDDAYGMIRGVEGEDRLPGDVLPDWRVESWMPLASLPMKLGLKSTSGQRKGSLPTVMKLPSSNSWVFSELSVANFT